MRMLAEVLEPVEGVTAQGGRTVTYESLGWAWLSPGARRRRARDEAGEGAREVEVLAAEARADPRVVEGRVLRFGGADWRIAAAHGEPGRPGRLLLSLERGR